jgi:hypothetical protein
LAGAGFSSSAAGCRDHHSTCARSNDSASEKNRHRKSNSAEACGSGTRSCPGRDSSSGRCESRHDCGASCHHAEGRDKHNSCDYRGCRAESGKRKFGGQHSFDDFRYGRFGFQHRWCCNFRRDDYCWFDEGRRDSGKRSGHGEFNEVSSFGKFSFGHTDEHFRIWRGNAQRSRQGRSWRRCRWRRWQAWWRPRCS